MTDQRISLSDCHRLSQGRLVALKADKIALRLRREKVELKNCFYFNYLHKEVLFYHTFVCLSVC